MKVLANSLSPKQMEFLMSQRLKNWKVCDHAVARMESKKISRTEMVQAIVKGNLIEFHNEARTRRMLLRNLEGTCIVLDIDTNLVITVYKNHSNDNHSTIDMSKYVCGPVEDSFVGCPN